MPRRRNRFPPDRGLQVRMALALLVQALLLVALVGGVVALALSVEAG